MIIIYVAIIIIIIIIIIVVIIITNGIKTISFILSKAGVVPMERASLDGL